MVEVITFPKPCPHCKGILFPVKKMYTSWLECRNEKCSYLVNEIEKATEPDESFPYTCCYTSR